MVLDYSLAITVMALPIGLTMMTLAVATAKGTIYGDGLIIGGAAIALLGLCFLIISMRIMQGKAREESEQREEDKRFREEDRKIHRQELELLERMLARLESSEGGTNKSN